MGKDVLAMNRDFADTFVSFARGKITKDEMNKAVRRLSHDVVRSYEPRKATGDTDRTKEVAKAASNER